MYTKYLLIILSIVLLSGDVNAFDDDYMYVEHYLGAGYKHDSEAGTTQDYTQDGFGLFYNVELEKKLYFRLAVYKQINKVQHDYGHYRTEFEIGYYFWSR